MSRFHSINHFLSPQLLTKPRILFCDEPTSGLDSFSAFAVMNTLRELSGHIEPKLFQKHHPVPRIVLFSIHQPTSEIFHLFTNIILMNAGRIIFDGTVQEAQKLFNSIGMICPSLYNPAEFYVNRISDPKIAEEIRQQKVVGGPRNLPSEPSSVVATTNGTKVSWIKQVFLLSHRGILNFLHAPRHYLIELLILSVSFQLG